MSLPISVNPSLYSHKGTPVRLLIEMNSGYKFAITPLQYQAAGIAFNDSVNYMLPSPVNKNKASVISNTGEIINEIDLADQDKPKSIIPMVIYPNGNTWEGEIFETETNNISILVWSWELAHLMNVDGKTEKFGFDKHWSEVPTTVAFMRDSKVLTVCGCVWLHHACKTCNYASK